MITTTIVTHLILSWGLHKSYGNRRAMFDFDLTYEDLKRKNLDYPASASSCNAKRIRAGYNNVVSADPLYDLGWLNLSKQMDHVIQQLATQLELDRYVDRVQLIG